MKGRERSRGGSAPTYDLKKPSTDPMASRRAKALSSMTKASATLLPSARTLIASFSSMPSPTSLATARRHHATVSNALTGTVWGWAPDARR